uniref:Uncharacterized protein n=1 Tax=Salix viminalis TaxID=40686 RepID=A0A6N2MIR0_SALVM
MVNPVPSRQSHHFQGQAFSGTAPPSIPKRHQLKPVSSPLWVVKPFRISPLMISSSPIFFPVALLSNTA